jgi:glycerol uptake facilitator-like aquaporin
VNGNYVVTPTIAIGYGYTWFYGDFIFNENDKITINPTLSFGLIGDISLQNDFSFQKITGMFVGGFVGVGSFSLFIGYDFISLSGSLGLGGRIDLYTINQKFFKPIGKVREVRRHKSIAPMISEE